MAESEAKYQIRKGIVKLVEYPFALREGDLMIEKSSLTHKDKVFTSMSLVEITYVKGDVVMAKSATLDKASNPQPKPVEKHNRLYPAIISAIDPIDGRTQGRHVFFVHSYVLKDMYKELIKNENNRCNAVVSVIMDDENRASAYVSAVSEFC